MSNDNVQSNEDLTDIVVTTIKRVVENVIGGKTYVSTNVRKWSGKVVNDCLKMLVASTGPRKYIVSAMMMENMGIDPYVATSSCWDNNTDGHCIIRWNNSTIRCIVWVYTLQV